MAYNASQEFAGILESSPDLSRWALLRQLQVLLRHDEVKYLKRRKKVADVAFYNLLRLSSSLSFSVSESRLPSARLIVCCFNKSSLREYNLHLSPSLSISLLRFSSISLCLFSSFSLFYCISIQYFFLSLSISLLSFPYAPSLSMLIPLYLSVFSLSFCLHIQSFLFICFLYFTKYRSLCFNLLFFIYLYLRPAHLRRLKHLHFFASKRQRMRTTLAGWRRLRRYKPTV